MAKQTTTEQAPIPGVRVRVTPDWHDRPVCDQARCELCGGDVSHPDRLCYSCAERPPKSHADSYFTDGIA